MNLSGEGNLFVGFWVGVCESSGGENFLWAIREAS